MDVLGRLDRFVDAILHYQLRQIAIGRFELLIAPSNRFADTGLEPIVEAAESVLSEAVLDVKLVPAIPPERSGKRRAFVSELARKNE